MVPVNNMVEMRTILYCCKYLFAGKWHKVTTYLGNGMIPKVSITISPSYNGLESIEMDYDGSRLLERIVDDYINDLCHKDHYICLKRELISYVAEEADTLNNIQRTLSINIEDSGYRCHLQVIKSGNKKELEDVFPFESSIEESYSALRVQLEGK